MVKITSGKFTCTDVYFCHFIGRQPDSEETLRVFELLHGGVLSGHPSRYHFPARTAQRFRASEQPPSRLPTPSPDSAASPDVRIATPKRSNLTTISPSNIHHNTCCRFSSHDILSHKFQIHFSDTKQMQLTVPLQRITQPAQLSSTRRLFQ